MQTQAPIERKVAAAAPPYAILVIHVPLADFEALARVLRDLPAAFRLPIVVTLRHHDRTDVTMADLSARLQPHTSLPVRWIGHRVPLRAGTVSLAMPGDAVVVSCDGVAQRLHGVGTGPSRSAKVLLESIAASYGERALVLALGGLRGEDAMVVGSVKAHGATLIAQDEAAAQAWGSASMGGLDLVLPLERIAATLVRITAAIRRPDGTGKHRCVPAQLFARTPAIPHEVAAVQRAMHRVLGAIETIYPADACPPADALRETLGLAIADELRPVVANAGRALIVDCAPSIADTGVDPDRVRELCRRLLTSVLAASAGNVEIRISSMRLFLQIVVSAAHATDRTAPRAAADRDDLQALLRPLRGHVVATKRKGRIEYAVWLPRAVRASSSSRSRDPSSPGDRGTH